MLVGGGGLRAVPGPRLRLAVVKEVGVRVQQIKTEGANQEGGGGILILRGSPAVGQQQRKPRNRD